jgi:hypothetical protein
MKTNYSPWTIPADWELKWFNEAAELATIKAILDGTSHARSWSDIQGTWGWQHPPKPRVIRVEKVKKSARLKPEKVVKEPAMTRQGRRVYRILLSNGYSREDAKRMANELTGVE